MRLDHRTNLEKQVQILIHTGQMQVILGAMRSPPRAAEAIADAVDPALKLTAEPVDLGVPLKGTAEAISQHVNQTLEAVGRATAGLQRANLPPLVERGAVFAEPPPQLSRYVGPSCSSPYVVRPSQSGSVSHTVER